MPNEIKTSTNLRATQNVKNNKKLGHIHTTVDMQSIT